MDAIKLLGGLLGNNATGGDLLGTLIKGAVGGGAAPQQQQRSAGGLLGGLLGGGGGAAPAGGGGGIMGNILKAAVMKQMGMGGGGRAAAPAAGGGAGGLLGALLGGGAEEPQQQQQDPLAGIPQQDANDQATLLIRAMCNAAKSDGQIDEAEQQAIIGRLGGDLDQAESDFLRKELSTPLDVAGFTRSVPRELGPTVYAMSVMTVKVDTRQEAQYLGQLAQGLGLDQQQVGQIHQQLGLS